MPRFAPGDTVQTPYGKGVVREVRNGGRISVELQHRALVISEHDVALLPPDTRPRGRPSTAPASAAPDGETPSPPALRSREIDLHGLTVEESLARIDVALNDALLANAAEIRVIHGRSGGKIRGALHKRLREIPAVRTFRVDPRNAGVTIVSL